MEIGIVKAAKDAGSSAFGVIVTSVGQKCWSPITFGFFQQRASDLWNESKQAVETVLKDRT
jgi:hypothetical protein